MLFAGAILAETIGGPASVVVCLPVRRAPYPGGEGVGLGGVVAPEEEICSGTLCVDWGLQLVIVQSF